MDEQDPRGHIKSSEKVDCIYMSIYADPEGLVELKVGDKIPGEAYAISYMEKYTNKYDEDFVEILDEYNGTITFSLGSEAFLCKKEAIKDVVRRLDKKLDAAKTIIKRIKVIKSNLVFSQTVESIFVTRWYDPEGLVELEVGDTIPGIECEVSDIKKLTRGDKKIFVQITDKNGDTHDYIMGIEAFECEKKASQNVVEKIDTKIGLTRELIARYRKPTKIDQGYKIIKRLEDIKSNFNMLGEA